AEKCVNRPRCRIKAHHPVRSRVTWMSPKRSQSLRSTKPPSGVYSLGGLAGVSPDLWGKLSDASTHTRSSKCQPASKFDPSSASKFDPLVRRGLAVALVSSELAGIAEARRARVI